MSATLTPILIHTPDSEAWPAQVEMILSAMDVARFHGPERRGHERSSTRLIATLRLHAEVDDLITLYSRDLDGRGMGFITRDRLPLGYKGRVSLPHPQSGVEMTLACTVLRCREAVAGWFEGAIGFARQQPTFVDEGGGGTEMVWAVGRSKMQLVRD